MGLRRAPREVYRVFREDDFFALDAHECVVDDTACRPAGADGSSRGLIVLCALLAALGGLSVFVYVAVSGHRARRRGSPRMYTAEKPRSHMPERRRDSAYGQLTRMSAIDPRGARASQMRTRRVVQTRARPSRRPRISRPIVSQDAREAPVSSAPGGAAQRIGSAAGDPSAAGVSEAAQGSAPRADEFGFER
jgi:hypothetical protein